MDQLTFTAAHLFHDRADRLFGNVHHQMLHRLVQQTVDLFEQHTGGADLELVTFPAHVLDQNRQMHLTASGNPERLGGVGILHSQGDVF